MMHRFMRKMVLGLSGLALVGAMAGTVQAAEPADVFIKRISSDVLDTARDNTRVKAGDTSVILNLVEQKIIPYVDFQRMTALAAGRFWRQATPEQQAALIAEFRSLLIYTYSGALTKVADQRVTFQPLRTEPTDGDVEVRSMVTQSRGQPIQLNYRVEKSGDGWKVYDVNIFGAWLVESYKNTFSSEITKNGMDGLIKTLQAKNKERAAAFSTSAAKN